MYSRMYHHKTSANWREWAIVTGYKSAHVVGLFFFVSARDSVSLLCIGLTVWVHGLLTCARSRHSTSVATCISRTSSTLKAFQDGPCKTSFRNDVLTEQWILTDPCGYLGPQGSFRVKGSLVQTCTCTEYTCASPLLVCTRSYDVTANFWLVIVQKI